MCFVILFSSKAYSFDSFDALVLDCQRGRLAQYKLEDNDNSVDLVDIQFLFRCLDYLRGYVQGFSLIVVAVNDEKYNACKLGLEYFELNEFIDFLFREELDEEIAQKASLDMVLGILLIKYLGCESVLLK